MADRAQLLDTREMARFVARGFLRFDSLVWIGFNGKHDDCDADERRFLVGYSRNFRMLAVSTSVGKLKQPNASDKGTISLSPIRFSSLCSKVTGFLHAIGTSCLTIKGHGMKRSTGQVLTIHG